VGMLPRTYNQNTLSTELGLTPRAIATALRDVPPDAFDERGRPLWRLRTALGGLGFTRGGGSTAYEQSRSRWMAARAEEAELSLLERRGVLVELDPLVREIERRWQNIILVSRNRLLALPSKLASRFGQLRSAQTTFEISMKLVREVLTQLAASSEQAVKLPAARAKARRQPEAEVEENDDEENLSRDGADRGPRNVDAESRSQQAADVAPSRGARRRGAARAGACPAEPDRR